MSTRPQAGSASSKGTAPECADRDSEKATALLHRDGRAPLPHVRQEVLSRCSCHIHRLLLIVYAVDLRQPEKISQQDSSQLPEAHTEADEEEADLYVVGITGVCVGAGDWQGHALTGAPKRIAAECLSLFYALANEHEVQALLLHDRQRAKLAPHRNSPSLG